MYFGSPLLPVYFVIMHSASYGQFFKKKRRIEFLYKTLLIVILTRVDRKIIIKLWMHVQGKPTVFLHTAMYNLTITALQRIKLILRLRLVLREKSGSGYARALIRRTLTVTSVIVALQLFYSQLCFFLSQALFIIMHGWLRAWVHLACYCQECTGSM